MLKSGSQVQAANDQQVINSAARRRQAKPATEKRAAAPAVLVVVGLLAAAAWWRRRQKSKGHTGKSPAPKSGQANRAARESSTSNLPRSKVGNNKKNKDRKRDERERRAEKREKGGGRSGPSDPGHAEETDNTIILTSKFVDSTPSTVSNLPKAQRKGAPSGGEGIDPAMAETWRRKS